MMTYRLSKHHIHGRTAHRGVSCCWFDAPASHQWHPRTGKQTVHRHTGNSTSWEPAK